MSGSRSIRALVAGGLALLGAATAGAGTVSGNVRLLERGGRKAKDLSDIVVYVDGVKAPAPPTRAVITMRHKAFTPRIVVIPVGGTVEFPNADPILHNAFSVSGPNRFDLGLYKRPKSGSWTFRSPGVVRVYCNIHPQMSAIVLVRDNPYFTLASPDGSFRIDGVPAGHYSLKAWEERANAVGLEITVPAHGGVGAQFVLDASRFKRVRHKNKYGKDYSRGDKY